MDTVTNKFNEYPTNTTYKARNKPNTHNTSTIKTRKEPNTKKHTTQPGASPYPGLGKE
ncbi:hypothetical protein [Vulcanisaeta thermophila]|uniref:hypothetical protein n=1 Tax=Vulcanisaeta thermophila TaxID=867917 RepID=UPI001EE20FA5|nr:hypothetical protein [Vulcanisaeta thermophila]